jgi:hypothetical protein
LSTKPPLALVLAPSTGAFELRDGRYEQVARMVGDEPFRAERPFPIKVVPARLVAGLLPG